jgi:hypothetical protein
MRNGFKLALVTLGLLAMFLSVAQAQKISGTITGVVTDQTGAVVPGATVTVTNQQTGASRAVTTNGEGGFTAQELEPGTYNVNVSKTGFKEAIQKDVTVHVSNTTSLNVRLAVGATGEQVTVEAQGVELNTDNGEVGNVVTGAQVRELPLNGRNFVQLTTLMPGVSTSENFDNKNKGLMGGVDISFSGAPSNANQWRVDGANNNDIGSQRTILLYPSVDGIEEFKILRNSYGPEYGGAGGAQINVITKGGGNNFHGDAYYFGRNAALNAKNYFIGLNHCTSPGDVTCQKQSLTRNDYGYTFGGPIKQDKVFFFWSEEWNIERRGAVRHDFVPSAQERLGNFSDLAACPAGSGAPSVPNFPAGTTSAPGVLTPANVSPFGQAYASQTPLPTTSVCNTFDWIAQVKVPVNWREENIRTDIKITKNNTLMLRYAQDAWDNPIHGSANGEAGLWGTQDFPRVSDAWKQPSKMAIGRLTSTLGSSTVNDFQFSWSDSQINISQAGDDPAFASKVTSLFPTVFPSANKLHAGNLPVPVCWCSTFFGVQSPWGNRQDLYTWRDDLSKVVKNHVFKVGVLYDRNAKDEEQGAEAGAMWGATGYQKVAWDGGTNNFYGNMLLKGETWGAQETARNVIADIRWRDTEFYAGDTWKLRRNLTLDYGFRWSFMRPEYMDQNDWSSFSAANWKASLAGDPCNGVLLPAGGKAGAALCASLGSKVTPAFSPYRSLVPPNNHLIAPRVGFAWDVFGTSRFVVRSGLGQFFARDPVGFALRMKSANPPYGVGASGYRTFDGPLVPGVTLFDNGGGAGGGNPWPQGGTPTQGMQNDTNVANTWQWNVTTETLLAKDTKLEVGWVALRGVHLASAIDINQIAPKDRLSYILRGIANGGDSRSDLFPFGAQTVGQITEWGHRGDSIYHSLQAMFSTKLGRNSTVQSSYTWSHNIATSTLDYVGTSTALPDTYNSAANRGNANYDRRHVFNFNLVYNLPTMASYNQLLRGVAGGWEAGSIFNYASGSALTISGSVGGICPSQAQLAACNAGTVATTGFNPWGVNNAGTFGARPNTIFSQPCNLGSNTQWLNPAAFTYNGFKIGGYPNAGSGQCPGPGVEDMDFSLMKNWVLPFKGKRIFTEGTKLQFRIEAFNLFNHPMFRFNNNGNTISYNATGTLPNGKVVGFLAPDNTIQGTVLGSGTTFGKPPLLSGIGNREIQYALKFIF